MDILQYQEASGRTAKTLDFIREDLFPSHDKLCFELVNCIVQGQVADLIKRGLFYKEPVERLDERSIKFAESAERLYEMTANDTTRRLSNTHIDVIHAALGMMSEAAEVLEEAVNSFVEQRELNLVNLEEEGGDHMWYNALLFRAIQSDFIKAGTKNLAKLAKRYPDKFTEFNALNRDLDAEQKVLAS